jgi:FXSXX-COOH protein
MTTIHLPDTQPQPEGPERVPLARLARGVVSPALTRIVPRAQESRGPGRVAVAAFQSSV